MLWFDAPFRQPLWRKISQVRGHNELSTALHGNSKYVAILRFIRHCPDEFFIALHRCFRKMLLNLIEQMRYLLRR